MQLMRYAPLNLSPLEPVALDIPGILAELRLLADNLPAAREELAAATRHADRTRDDWASNVAEQRQVWGAAAGHLPTPERIGQAHDAATVVAERVAEWEGRQSALLVVLREQLPAEEAAIDREQEAVEEEERAVAAREDRLRELTTALVEFEGYEVTGGRISVAYKPLIGHTDSLRSELFVAQRRLNERRAMVAKARNEIAVFERRVAPDRVEDRS